MSVNTALNIELEKRIAETIESVTNNLSDGQCGGNLYYSTIGYLQAMRQVQEEIKTLKEKLTGVGS